MAGYYPCSFSVFSGPRPKKKELGQYRAILTAPLVNIPFWELLRKAINRHMLRDTPLSILYRL